MSPWFIDKNIGIQRFKNDASLSEAEVATIVSWVDTGAVEGDRADMPDQRVFPDSGGWGIGKPDLVVTQEVPFKMYAAGSDCWETFTVDAGLTEDRWIRAVQLKPGNPKIVHHLRFPRSAGRSQPCRGSKRGRSAGSVLTGADTFGRGRTAGRRRKQRRQRRWRKYRGPAAGLVTFAPLESVLVDGKASTRVRFSEPGEYTLQAAVDDGSLYVGTYCCWINAEATVKVE